MTVGKKIKTIDKKIKQNRTQYNLDRQTAKTSTLSSENVSKYEFLTVEDVLPEKGLLEKAATIKKIEYSPLRSVLKNKLALKRISISFLKIKKVLLITMENGVKVEHE